VLVNITSGPSLGIREATTATSVIQKEAGDDVEVIFGTVIDEDLQDGLRVTVIATGFDRDRDEQENAGDASAQSQSEGDASNASNGSDGNMRRTVPLDDSEGSPVYKYKGEDNLRHLDTPAYERRTSPLRSRRKREEENRDGASSNGPQGGEASASGQQTSGQDGARQDGTRQDGTRQNASGGDNAADGSDDEPVIRRLRADDVDRQKPGRGDRSTSSGNDASDDNDTDDDTPAFLRKMMD
jgi:cell division protein FtsZ